MRTLRVIPIGPSSSYLVNNPTLVIELHVTIVAGLKPQISAVWGMSPAEVPKQIELLGVEPLKLYKPINSIALQGWT